MQYSISGRRLPMTLLVCRTLVWIQAAITILGGVFVVLTVVMLGSGTSIPFLDGTLSGAAAAGIGLVYIATGCTLTWLGVALGRRSGWARIAIVGALLFLAVLDLFRSFAMSTSTAVDIALDIAVVALLFAPETRRALEGGATA